MGIKRKRYAGEGMIVSEIGTTIFTRPMGFLSRLCRRLIGKKPKDPSALTRDFYAAITSDQSYVILGEARYGMANRMASLKKPKPNAPQKKNLGAG